MKNIHVLPTENYKQDYTLQNGEVVEVVRLGQLVKHNQTNEFSINKNPQWAASCDTDVQVPHHIYITSDEEIKEDYVIAYGVVIKVMMFDKETLYFVNGTKAKREDCKKIILTTDQDLIKDGVQAIDDEFLEWFVKNPSCEEVKIIYGLFNTMGRQVDPMNLGQNHSQCVWIYKIIIPKEEPKTTGDIGVDYALAQSKAIQKSMHLDAEIAYKSLSKQETLEKTAVEWLIEEMIFRLAIRIENTIDGVKLLEEAKEMEKQQIIDAWIDGNDSEPMETSSYYAEQYYNETFNK